MKRASALIAALLVAGGVAALGLREHRTKADALDSARSSTELTTASGTGAPGEDDELRRLRAEVQNKDRIIRELVAKDATKDVMNAAQAANAAKLESERADPASHARQVLDERIAATSASPSAAELEGALTAAMSKTELGTARITERRCGGSLCRVTLAADSPAALNASIEALVDHLPKAMGASAIYEAEDGTRDVYLARTSEALAPEAAPTAKTQ